MKKVFILFAAVAMFASCTTSTTNEETVTTDSTTVDTTSATTIINNISDSLENGNIKTDTVSK